LLRQLQKLVFGARPSGQNRPFSSLGPKKFFRAHGTEKLFSSRTRPQPRVLFIFFLNCDTIILLETDVVTRYLNCFPIEQRKGKFSYLYSDQTSINLNKQAIYSENYYTKMETSSEAILTSAKIRLPIMVSE
jgi:hypothetical protein